MRVDIPGRDPVDLIYCTNIHAAETLEGVMEALDAVAAPLRERLCPSSRLGLGLYVPADLAHRLAAGGEPARDVNRFLAERHLSVVAVNAFPAGGFHSGRVKEQVFRPDWTEPARLRHTVDAARFLAGHLPEGATGTVSTVPGSFREFGADPSSVARGLVAAACEFSAIERRTGRHIVLCPEPEPFGLFETTAEAVAFFRDVLRPEASRLGASDAADRHLALCLDACHAAVAFEDPAAMLAIPAADGVAVGRLQLSAGLVARGAGDRDALLPFAEARYLHQTFVRHAGGIARYRDLPEFLAAPASRSPEPFEARIHFHVPVDRTEVGGLRTTRPFLDTILALVREGRISGPLEIETYAFAVLPDPAADRTASLIDSLEREFAHVLGELGPAKENLT